MNVNKIPVVKLASMAAGQYSIALPPNLERYVRKIKYEHAAGEFPTVTITFVAEMEIDAGQVPPIGTQTIWRVTDFLHEEEE